MDNTYSKDETHIKLEVYMDITDTNRYAILLWTDTELCGANVIEYYQLRFQIEFLIRDAKQYTGLEECQARSEVKFFYCVLTHIFLFQKTAELLISTVIIFTNFKKIIIWYHT